MKRIILYGIGFFICLNLLNYLFMLDTLFGIFLSLPILYLLLILITTFSNTTPTSIRAKQDGISISKSYDDYMKGLTNEFHKKTNDFITIPWEDIEYWYLKQGPEYYNNNLFINKYSFNSYNTIIIKFKNHREEIQPYNSRNNILVHNMFKYGFDKKIEMGNDPGGDFVEKSNTDSFFLIIIFLVILLISLYLITHS